MNLGVVFYSRTNQTKRFVEKLKVELPSLEIKQILDGSEVFDFPYVLITPTYGWGNVPEQVENFLTNKTNSDNIKGVVSSGNINWGENNHAKAGEKVAKEYNVPWLHKYELRGTEEDVNIVLNSISELEDRLK